MNELNDFKTAIFEALNCGPEHINENGVIQRFSTNGKQHDKAGWCVFFANDGIAAGAFGDYRSGLSSSWCSKKPNELTPEQRENFKKQVEAAQKKQAEEIKAKQADAAMRAQIIWDAAGPCEDHQYLTDKRVKSHGLKKGRWTRTNQETGEIWLDVPDALLVPIKDGKKIVSLQAIFPTQIGGRNKDFLSGGKKSGGYFPIGKPQKNESGLELIYICEGYSTGATIHELTGDAVIVAFDAGNLPPVCKRIREAFPSANLVIVADNDRFPNDQGVVHETGIKKAREAAEEARAHVIIPQFPAEFDDQKPTDANDLFNLCSADETLKQLRSYAKPPALPAHEETETNNELGPVSVDTITPLIDTGGKGKPLSTIENLQEILRRLGVTVRYDVIKKEEELLIPRHTFSLDNAGNASLAYILSWCGRFNYPVGQVSDYITYLADQNLHNPVATWITSKPWDGVSRWAEFMDTVKSTNEPLKCILMHRWMISAVAAAVEPDGISAHGVLVFLGNQYVGKTKWFKTLVPESLGVIQDGVRLDPKDKDSVKQCVSNWLVELGEIDATFKKSDIAELKAFLTRKSDTFRRAYAKKESRYARKTVFFGSVNPRIYLNDPTGNRRFWTVEVTHLDHSHKLDMQQVWAEFLHMYKTGGEGYYLTAEEMAALNESNLEYTSTDAVDERLTALLDWETPEARWEWITTTEALLLAGVDRPTKADITKASILIREINGDRAKRTSKGRLVFCPPRKIA